MGIFPIGSKAFGVGVELPPPVESSFVKGCNLRSTNFVPNPFHGSTQ